MRAAEHRDAGAGLCHITVHWRAVCRWIAAGGRDRDLPDAADLCALDAQKVQRSEHIGRGHRLRPAADAYPGIHACIPVRRHFHGLRDADGGVRLCGRLWSVDRGVPVSRDPRAAAGTHHRHVIDGRRDGAVHAAAAQAFSWVLSAAQVPQELAALLAAAHGNATLFMICSIIGLVVLGSLLEGLPALLILAPLLLPMAPALGISQLHYGIVLLIAMGIGAFLPPLGVGFYIACAVARAPMGRSSQIMVRTWWCCC